MSGTISIHLEDAGAARLIITKTTKRTYCQYEIKDKDGVEIYFVSKSAYDYSGLIAVPINDGVIDTNGAQMKLMKIREETWPSIRSKMVYSTSEEPSSASALKEFHLQMTTSCCSGARWELRSGDGELIIRNDDDSTRDEAGCVAPWRQGGLINSKIFAKDGETQIGRIVGKKTSGSCSMNSQHTQEVRLEVQQDLPQDVNQDALLAAYFFLDLELDWWKRAMDLPCHMIYLLLMNVIISYFMNICIIKWVLGWSPLSSPSIIELAFFAVWGLFLLIFIIVYLRHILYHPKPKTHAKNNV